MRDAGIIADHEQHRYTLIKPFKFRGESVRAMTYTPDFVSSTFIIECKGFANDAFPNKWKLFKWFMIQEKMEHDLYLVKNQKQVQEMIQDILSKRNKNPLIQYTSELANVTSDNSELLKSIINTEEGGALHSF